jgi:hypothetical protein
METLKTLHKKYIELDRLVKYLYANQGGGGGDVGSDPIWTAAGDLAVGSGSSTATTLSLGAAYSTLTVNATATGIAWVAPGAPAQADVDMNGFNVNNLDTVTFQGGQGISWNTKYHLIEVPTGDGAIHKLGMDTMFDVHNATGTLIEKGEVIYPTGTSTNGVSNVDRAIANTHETITGPIGFAAADIPNGTTGHVMVEGVLDPLDTSGLSEGPAYLSASIPGALTSVKPVFPNYEVLIGIVDKVGVSDGVFTVDSSHSVKDTLFGAWDGGFREGFDFLVSSDGATITGSIERTGGGNLTMLFAEGFVTLDCTPPQTITLNAGTDTVPQPNYIYIPASTKVLTVSTSGFPLNIEHIKIADVVVQSAGKVQVQGPLANRNWNDHVKTTGDNGHLLHISERLRQNPASWLAGAAGSSTVDSPTASNVYVAVTGGQVYQLHRQDFPAVDLQTGGDVHIINHFTTPYVDVTNLNTQTADSTGASLANRSFSFVLWGVQNKGGQHCPIMINLPKGSYSRTNPDAAVSDIEGFAVYDIPDTFRGKGFLIARFTYQLASNGTDWILYDTEDLRGKVPNSTAGASSGGGAGVTEFTGLTDTPNAYTGQALKGVRVAAGESALEFYDGIEKVGTPVNNQMTYWTGDGTVAGSEDAVITGSSLSLGKDETIASYGIINLRGSNSFQGGSLTIHHGSSADSFEDAWRFEASNTNSVFKLTGGFSGDWMFLDGQNSQIEFYKALTSNQSIANINATGSTALTTKGYVDSLAPTSGNGIDVTSSVVSLGGAVTSNILLKATTDDNRSISIESEDISGNKYNYITTGGSLTQRNVDMGTGDYSSLTPSENTEAAIFGRSYPTYSNVTLGTWGNGGAVETSLVFDTNTGILLTDNQFTKGIVYQADYSANFTDRSLIDKGYVDTTIAGAGYGNVFKVGTPAVDEMAIWTGDGTLGRTSEIRATDGPRAHLFVGTNTSKTGQITLYGDGVSSGGNVSFYSGQTAPDEFFRIGVDDATTDFFINYQGAGTNIFEIEFATQYIKLFSEQVILDTSSAPFVFQADNGGQPIQIKSDAASSVYNSQIELATSSVYLASDHNSGTEGAYLQATTSGDTWRSMLGVTNETGNGQDITIGRFSSGGTPVMRVQDTINSKGLVYQADYSANFTDRSLIDKAYVDSNFIANTGTNLLDVSASDFILEANGGNKVWFKSDPSIGTTNTFYYQSETAVTLETTHDVGSETATVNVSTFNDGYSVSLSAVGPASTQQHIRIGGFQSQVAAMTVTDGINSKGLEYAGDYSANYTARSLVDKAYVDANSFTSPLTTKGDILAFDTGNVRLPVSGNNGWVLSEDSTQPTGLKWIALAGGGDMVLSAAQDVTGLKTFDPATLGVRNVADTFTTTFTNLATAARSLTLPDVTSTLLAHTGANAAVDFNTQALTAGTFNGIEIITNGEYNSIGSSVVAPGNESHFFGDNIAYNGLGTMVGNMVIGSYSLGGGGSADASNNVVMGLYAALTKSHGDYNVVIGYNANDQGGGDSNVIIGNDAGYETPGYDNVSIGTSAGRNQFGSYNVGIGSETFYSGNDEEGSYNIGIGYWANSALPAPVTNPGGAKTVASTAIPIGGSDITVTAHGFGEQGSVVSLTMTTDGTLPTGYTPGNDYLFEIVNANTIKVILNARRQPDTFADQGTGNHTFTPYTKTNNAIAIGKNANNTKSNQVMLGGAEITETVLRGAVTGATTYNNLDIIEQTSNAIVIGDGNPTGVPLETVMIGPDQLYNTGGSPQPLVKQNVLIGSSILGGGAATATTPEANSQRNVYLGNYVAQSARFGNDNVGIGYDAFDEIYGDDNVALGNSTGYQVMGNSNVAIGFQAGDYTYGNRNVAIGHEAGRFMTIWGQGNDNIMIGTRSNKNISGPTANPGGAKTIAFTDVNTTTNIITVTAHGFGEVGATVILNATTDGTLPAGLDASNGWYKVLSVNTIQPLQTSAGIIRDLTTQGTGNHTFTPNIVYSNMIAIGTDATNTASNQIILGNTTHTQTILNGEVDVQDNSVGFTLQTYTGTVATTDIDWRNGNKAKFTFGAGNETLTFTNPTKPASFTLIIVQDGVGGRTITWPTILWQGGTAPTLSTGIGAIDIVSFMYDGTNWYGSAALDFS